MKIVIGQLFGFVQPNDKKNTFFSQELHDYGGGIPNELVIMLERCVGLNTRWPGLFPDAYLTYRFYDLPPHVSQTAQCSADPVFNDTTSYPLAVTADVLHYLRYDSLETHTKKCVQGGFSRDLGF